MLVYIYIPAPWILWVWGDVPTKIKGIFRFHPMSDVGEFFWGIHRANMVIGDGLHKAITISGGQGINKLPSCFSSPGVNPPFGESTHGKHGEIAINPVMRVDMLMAWTWIYIEFYRGWMSISHQFHLTWSYCGYLWMVAKSCTSWMVNIPW